MRKSCILLGLSLLLLVATFAQASEQLDIEKIRRDIQRNGWSFEVDDTFSYGLTAEQRQNLRGYNPPADYQKILDQNLKIFPVEKDLASNLDWRELGGVTPVKNQGDCGSCWAFAATAELESFIKIYYGVEMDLSEQQIVSCNPYGADCDGGWANAAYFVFQQYGGVQENCMPYAGMNPPGAPCVQDQYKKYGFITGWHSISNNVEQIKAALQDGPVCTAIDASDEFEAYSSGCYDVPGGWTNHLVLIVGYDDRACDGNGAWIIKNSWGPDFGEGGFIHVQYGAGSVGTSLTQLEYAAPPTSLEFSPQISAQPLISDQVTQLTWDSSGAMTPTVDIWFGQHGHCHDLLVADGVPNTGSFDWVVPNLGTNYGSLVIHPSSGTEDGFGVTENYIQIIGHKTRYVSPAGSNIAPYDTPETAAHSINAAVAACTGTDSVLVAGGNYVGSVAVGTTVRLLGGFSENFGARDIEAYPTVIQSGNTAVRFLEGSGDFGMVDGFVFRDCTGGNTGEPESGQHGGAIYVNNASPTITNCLFEDNRAAPGTGNGFGGAICVVGGEPLIENCRFQHNIATKGGALGVFGGAHPVLTDCVITANSCSDSLDSYAGAGIFVREAQISVIGGEITLNGGSGSGGGLQVENGTASLDRVDLRGNRAMGAGGGVMALGSQVFVNNSRIQNNSAANGSGGGLSATGTELQLRNVHFSGNHSSIMGGAVFASGASGAVENCLVAGNASATGGGLVVLSEWGFNVRNNIVTDNTGGGMMTVGAQLSAGHNNVWQNAGADYVSMTAPETDFSLDPLYVDQDAGDFGLAQFSPCIDRGAQDPTCLDPDGSRADVGLLGGPGADFVAPSRVSGAALEDQGDGSWRLTWDASPEENISHYVVYRDTAEVFVPTPLKALATVEHPQTFFVDSPGMECYYLVAAVDDQGYSGGYSDQLATSGSVSAAGDGDLPRSLAISGVVPNPFNPRTSIRYDVPRTGRVQLAVYDIRGRLVEELVAGMVEAGQHTAVWNGTDRQGRSVAAGIYFARMSDGHSVTTTKMVLAK